MKTLTAVMALATSFVATTPALSLVMRSSSSAVARSAGGALRRGRRSLVMVESAGAGTAPGGASSASSFGTSTGPIGGGRSPDKLLTDAQDVLTDAVKIAQDVGLQTTLRRTIRGQRAILQTAVELAQELPRPAGSLPFPFPPSPPAELLSGKPLAEAIPAYLATLPKDLAPRTLRKLFERLGATYVKLGQFVASSPTVFPEEYVLEFQNCLDSTPTVSFETVKTIVEADLGKPLSEVYSKFDETPLASASVAQVHAARLVSGEDVVVKVQKPGVKDTLAADLGFLEVAAKALEFIAPDLSRLSVAAIVQDLRVSGGREERGVLALILASVRHAPFFPPFFPPFRRFAASARNSRAMRWFLCLSFACSGASASVRYGASFFRETIWFKSLSLIASISFVVNPYIDAATSLYLNRHGMSSMKSSASMA